MDTHTYYDLLGVTPDADISEIKTAFRRLTMKIHPDSGGTDALFRRVKRAYDTLSDPVLRCQYDDSLSHQAEMYGNDDQESNAPGWIRVDDTPSGNEASESGYDDDHASSSIPRTEHDGAYRFNFTGNDNDHANSPPPHGDPRHTPPPSGSPRGDASGCQHDTEDPSHTPPPSGSPPGRNGFSSGDTPSGYPRHEQSSRTKVIVILLAVVYIVLLSNSQPVLFALLMLSLPIVGFIAIFIKWRKKWIGK